MLCQNCGSSFNLAGCPLCNMDKRRVNAEERAAGLRRDLDNVAMMLRVCAHRLRANGHGDLSDKAVDLLRRLGLQGSPLRAPTDTEASK